MAMILRLSLALWLMVDNGLAAYALNHTLRKGIDEILGPNAWGIYILLPIPFVLIVIIAFLLYRAFRSASPKKNDDPLEKPSPH